MNTASLLPGQHVRIVKGQYAGQVAEIRLAFDRSVEVYVMQGRHQVLAQVLGSSLDPKATRKAIRNQAATDAGVTWAWLTETLTEAEADAWLMLEI